MADYQRVGGNQLEAGPACAAGAGGLILGYFLAKSCSFLPFVIQGQLVWDNVILLKVLTSAVTTALILNSIFSAAASDKFEAARPRGGKGVVSVVMGSVILGTGMGFCGSSLGTPFMQLGAGIWGAGWIILGALAAPLLYGFTYEPVWQKLDAVARVEKSAFEELFGAASYWMVALPTAVLTGGLAIFLEFQFPTKDGVPEGIDVPDSWIPGLKDQLWMPYWSGIAVGLVDVICRAAGGPVEGYIDVYAYPVCAPVAAISEKANINTPAWFQNYGNSASLKGYILVGMMALGAFLSAFFTDMMSFEAGAVFFWNIIGGATMMIGALIAGGDSLSHGLAGTVSLNVVSWLALISMVLGAASSGQLMQFLAPDE